MLELIPSTIDQDAGRFTFPGVSVVGVEDITQFIVKAFSTQTSNLVEIQANDGSQHVTITGLGETILDVTSTEALLVRKNADGGDVLTVNTSTLSGIVTIQGDGGGAGASALLRVQSNSSFGGMSFRAPSGQNAFIEFIEGTTKVGSMEYNAGSNFTYVGGFNGHMLSLGSDAAGLIARILNVTNDDRVGIHTTGPSAKTHIDQPSTTGEIPVLLLDQADVDYVLVKVIATAEAASANRTLVADSDFGTPGALVGWVQIEIQDDGNRITDGDYWVPFYATPT